MDDQLKQPIVVLDCLQPLLIFICMLATEQMKFGLLCGQMYLGDAVDGIAPQLPQKGKPRLLRKWQTANCL